MKIDGQPQNNFPRTALLGLSIHFMREDDNARRTAMKCLGQCKMVGEIRVPWRAKSRDSKRQSRSQFAGSPYDSNR